MWTIIEACDQLKTSELGVFERAGRVYAKGQNNPERDLTLYQEHGIIPKYVADFLDYHEKRRAVG